MKKIFKMVLLILLAVIVIIIIGVTAFVNLSPQFGGDPSAESLKRMRQSSNYRDGKFYNQTQTVMTKPSSMFKGMKEFFSKKEDRKPQKPLPLVSFDKSMFSQKKTGLIITWLGHSSVLIGIEGKTLLIDPMMSKKASPVSFAGVGRFEGSLPVKVEDLPELDAVLITHDHYDHLDYGTILKLKDKVDKFYVPLGVKAHLEKWGVPAGNIFEHNWWEKSDFTEDITLTAAPTRHFSGRGITNRFSTLWCAWVIKGKKYSIYFGGDSGYASHFKETGEKYGPFDVTMLECGAYSKYWPSIHMLPEETVQAFIDLKGKILMPIHWAVFDLSIHPWTEPVERLLKKALEENVETTTPKIGECIIPGEYIPRKAWWR